MGHGAAVGASAALHHAEQPGVRGALQPGRAYLPSASLAAANPAGGTPCAGMCTGEEYLSYVTLFQNCETLSRELYDARLIWNGKLS